MEEQTHDDTDQNNPHSSTSNIFKKFQKLYAKQLKETDESSDGLKLKVKILENWVEDLTEQNVMLVKTVDELESEALKRLSMLEANITQSKETSLPDSTSGRNTYFSKGLNCQVETLCRELEQMKKQLLDKEKLISKYQTRIEELGSSIEGEKGVNCNRVLAQYFTKSESICEQDHNVQPSVYREETLVEVLGIKERSLTHLEHLTEQLEQKDQVISCLKQQLTQGSVDLLYRVRQQVDWFTENVTQQCSQGNCSEEFKKCITTMLEELKESIECCNLGPSDTSELGKESVTFVSALKKCLEQSKKDLCQSWKSISDTVQKMNKMDLSPLVDHWKKGLCKQKTLQNELQETVRSIVNSTCSSNANVESFTKSIETLQSLLFRFTDQLNNQPSGRSFTGWLKNLHCVVTELISKIQEITQIISDIRSSDDETHTELVSKMQVVDMLQFELKEDLGTELKAWEKLYKKEKAQRVNIDTLLATILHHQEIWNHLVACTDELMRETLRLSNNSTPNPKQAVYDKIQIPMEDRSKNLQSLISKISTDIRKSLCDIEQRQNQVSHLELDLSSVRAVLESAQEEIHDISKTCNTEAMKRKMTTLLLKLKKQVGNAITKTNSLIRGYANTKQQYISSSERISLLQKEWEELEQEVQCNLGQFVQDFKKPPKTYRVPCPTEAVLASYEQKRPTKPLLSQFRDVQKTLKKEDDAIKMVKGNVMDLKSNIKDRDKLTETQDKTICVLQNSLKRCHNEAGELRETIKRLEAEKCGIEIESKRKIQELESRKNHQKSEESLQLVIASLKESESKKAEIEKEHKEQLQKLQNKISELQSVIKSGEDASMKHHKTEAALQIVIANLKETICKERKKTCEMEKRNIKLREQVKHLEDCSKDASTSNKKTVDLIADLKEQITCWSNKASALEEQMKNISDKLCKSLQRVKELEQEICTKDITYKEEICKKQEEIHELTNAVQSLTERVNESRTELDATRLRTLETEVKLQSVCGAYDELKVKEREKEAQADKLQVALTQLSNKFVSRRLETGTSQCIRHYQEECAKYEALYNTTACKLRSKELELSSLKQEMDRLRSELDQVTMSSSQQREDESCPFLMERVHQLSKELQVAHSCQNRYESLLKEMREKCSKKEEENFQLKTQIKQITLQRDTALADLEQVQQEIKRLQVNNSSLQTTIKRLDQNNARFSEQMHKAVYETDHSAAVNLQPNIELQREISTVLTSQLRGVKQKLHNTKHDYKLLQAAYEELNRKYTMLQRGERDLEQVKDMASASKSVSRCRPCLAKPSKSVNYIKMPQSMAVQEHMEYLSHSKSWHKMDNKDADWKEKRWKQKLQEVIRGGFDPSEAMHHDTSSSN